MTGYFRISSALSQPRLNGVNGTPATTGQGSGNYQNGTTRIGLTTNSARPWNGNIYALALFTTILSEEDTDIVESGVPPAALDTFWDLVIAVGLKALDIPYSFYNERFTNYSGSRTAWLHYDRAAADKRSDQIQARKKWTYWQLQTAIVNKQWSLPSKMTLRDLRFAWHPRGMPWWKPSEEIVGDLKAIAGGLSNVQLVCQQRDTDFFENIDRNLEALQYVKDRAAEVLGPDHQFSLNWQAVFAGSTPDVEV